jgi:hypothetical protein
VLCPHLDDLIEEGVVTSSVLVGVGLEGRLQSAARVASASLVFEPCFEPLGVEPDELAVEGSRRRGRAADVRCDAHLHRAGVDGVDADQQRRRRHGAVLRDGLGFTTHGVEGVAELMDIDVGEHCDAHQASHDDRRHDEDEGVPGSSGDFAEERDIGGLGHWFSVVEPGWSDFQTDEYIIFRAFCQSIQSKTDRYKACCEFY